MKREIVRVDPTTVDKYQNPQILSQDPPECRKLLEDCYHFHKAEYTVRMRVIEVVGDALQLLLRVHYIVIPFVIDVSELTRSGRRPWWRSTINLVGNVVQIKAMIIQHIQSE